MAFVAENIWASLVRWTQDKLIELNSAGVLNNGQYIEWDAHASINDLPSSDLMGLKAFAVMEDENILNISCAIGIATMNETNLFRLRKAAATIFESLRRDNSISYYDADSGLVINQMVLVDGTHMTPVARADVRSIQFIQFEALLETPT